MAKAKILATFDAGRHSSQLISKNAHGEYRVRFFVDGVENKPARYFSDDRADAEGTALNEVRRLHMIDEGRHLAVYVSARGNTFALDRTFHKSGVTRPVVFNETAQHEEAEEGRNRRPNKVGGWARVVRNRVAFNHDERNRFAGAYSGEGPFGMHLRADLWHAVY